MTQDDPRSTQSQSNEEKPAGRKTEQKENDLLFWISAGTIIVIGLGVIGFMLISRSNRAINTLPPTIEPTATVASDLAVPKTIQLSSKPRPVISQLLSRLMSPADM
jgi:hypothetical protein